MWRILDSLFPPRETERLVREASLKELGARISPHLLPDTEYEVTALLPYKEPLVSALIIEAKYHGSKQAAKLLGQMLGEYLASYSTEQDEYEKRDIYVLPIPLSQEREKERGYNQVARITQYALTSLGLPDTIDRTILTRIRNTAPQTTLSGKERRQNMKGAFAAGTVSGKSTYILIDDVATTGATFAAAAGALHSAGAPNVVCVALAH